MTYPDLATIVRSLDRLEENMVAAEYRGHDPFDALLSPLFRLPLLRSNHLVRWGIQQVVKRSPFNLRTCLRVPTGVNPVTLGLTIQGRAERSTIGPGESSAHDEVIGQLLDRLEAVGSKGYSGACWGYDFDWEGRYVRIPAYVPTIVATGIITNALFILYERRRDERALKLCKSAVHFISRDLHRTEGQAGFCWSYSPLDQTAVFNATLKGARLMAQVYSVTGDDQWRDLARGTVRFVLAGQRVDGSWPYAHGDARTWVDHFHTGYVLDCLDAYERLVGDSAARTAIERGWTLYRRDLFTPDGIPKYYSTGLWPVDATACGQALLTLCRFGDLEGAVKTAMWTIEHLQRRDGAFGYQVRWSRRDLTPFMRWNNAWMYAGLATLAAALNSRK